MKRQNSYIIAKHKAMLLGKPHILLGSMFLMLMLVLVTIIVIA
jgi:hypothetical protein